MTDINNHLKRHLWQHG